MSYDKMAQVGEDGNISIGYLINLRHVVWRAYLYIKYQHMLPILQWFTHHCSLVCLFPHVDEYVRVPQSYLVTPI